MIFIKRYKVFFVIVIFLLGCLSVRILYLDISDGENYSRIVQSQSIVVREVSKKRAAICDRKMISLTDRETKNMFIDKNGNINSRRGVTFEMPLRRGSSQLAAHLIGYTSSDGTGLCGIEKKYDSILPTDTKIQLRYRADGAGKPLETPRLMADSQHENSEKYLKLTLDYHIQKIVEETMAEYISKGAAVILDVSSFDVLAMASTPTYSTEDATTENIKDEGQLLNRALCAYNAGSVFKIITSAAALDINNRYGERMFYCSGKYTGDGKYFFECNNPNGHKAQTMTKAFANSCNCAFYETGLCTGGAKLIETAVNFGLGCTVADMGTEESSGFLPQKESYTPNEIINLSIGQGEIMITPVQCAVIAAIVASGGIRKNVNTAQCLYNEKTGEQTNLRKEWEYRVLPEKNARFIGEMMRECVQSGTAREAAYSPTEIAGKTSSAESGWLLERGEFAVHGWFCGYFPYSNPKYAMAILCENGKSGAKSCVKPFIKICEEINKIYPFIQ